MDLSKLCCVLILFIIKIFVNAEQMNSSYFSDLEVSEWLPHRCQEIRDHFPYAEDGEYWLNVTQYEATGPGEEYVIVKVFCHNMTSQPKEYLTFYGDNHGLALSNNPLMQGDSKFYKVALQMYWIENGWLPRSSYSIAPGRQVATGQCGGRCGYCQPMFRTLTHRVFLSLHPTENLDASNATVVILKGGSFWFLSGQLLEKTTSALSSMNQQALYKTQLLALSTLHCFDVCQMYKNGPCFVFVFEADGICYF